MSVCAPLGACQLFAPPATASAIIKAAPATRARGCAAAKKATTAATRAMCFVIFCPLIGPTIAPGLPVYDRPPRRLVKFRAPRGRFCVFSRRFWTRFAPPAAVCVGVSGQKPARARIPSPRGAPGAMRCTDVKQARRRRRPFDKLRRRRPCGCRRPPVRQGGPCWPRIWPRAGTICRPPRSGRARGVGGKGGGYDRPNAMAVGGPLCGCFWQAAGNGDDDDRRRDCYILKNDNCFGRRLGSGRARPESGRGHQSSRARRPRGRAMIGGASAAEQVATSLLVGLIGAAALFVVVCLLDGRS